MRSTKSTCSKTGKNVRNNLASAAAAIASRLRTRPIEPLEPRVLFSTTDTWLNAAGGDWDTAANWSLGIPTAGEDAVINLTGTAPITHSTTANDSVNSITSNQPITLSAGTLNVTTTMNLSGGSLTLAGGALQGATVNGVSGAEVILTNSGGGLNGVTIGTGTVVDGTEASNAAVGITGGLTLNGTLNLGGGYNSGRSTNVYFYGPAAQTLAGTGTVFFGLANYSNIYAQGDNASNPEVLTIAAGITIDGGGGYGTSISGSYNPRYSGPVLYPGDTIINDGTIDASVGGNTFQLADSGNLTNNGTLEATSGAGLAAGNGNGTTTNTGTITAAAGSSVSVAGLTGNAGAAGLTGSGSSLTLGGSYTVNQNEAIPGGSTLTLNGTWNNTAALTEAAGGNLYLGGAGMTLASIGSFTNAGGAVYLTGSLNNSGTTLALTSVTGAWDLQGGSVTGGTITTSGPYDLILTNGGGGLNGVTIAAGSVVDGTEASNAAVGITGGLTLNGTLNLGGGYNSGRSTNVYFYGPAAQTLAGTGTVFFGLANYSNIYAQGDNASNPEVLTIAAGITIDGGGGYGTSISGSYNPRYSGPVLYPGDTIINDGTIDASVGGNTFQLADSGNLTNNGTLEATSGAGLAAGNGNGTTTNTGTITAAAGSSVSVAGLTGNAGAAGLTGSGSSLTLGGSYTVNQNEAIPGGSTLTLNGTWNNTAALTEAAGGNLYLGGAGMTLASIGSFTNAGGAVYLTGSLNNSGTTLALTSVTGAWDLQGGSVTGGTITTSGPYDLILTNGGGGLNGVTIAAGSVVDGTEASNAAVGITGGLTLNGTLNLGGGYNSGRSTNVYFYGPAAQTLAGTGTVFFGLANYSNIYAQGDNASNPEVLTIAAGITIDGGGGYGTSISGSYNPRYSGPVLYPGDTIINDGTIDASVGGNTFQLADSGNLTNNGTLEATSGAGLAAGNGNGTTTNTGTITAAAGSSVSVAGLTGNAGAAGLTGSGSSLTLGGSYTVNQNEAIPGGSTLTLNGTWNNTAALTEAAGGNLYLGGAGMTLASIGSFTNAGGAVYLTGSLNNSGTTLALTSVTGAWDLQGGSVTGGTITTSGPYDLILTNGGGGLNGVTIAAGSVVDGTEASNAAVGITGGLTLNGTLNLGGGYNSGRSTNVYFYGPAAQTLAGTGTVFFGLANYSNIYAQGDNASNPEVLTIAAGITIDGGGGYGTSISGSYNPRYSGPVLYPGDTIINDGTISVSSGGYPLVVGSSGTFLNNGTLEGTNGGGISINQTVAFNGSSSLSGYGAGTTYIYGNLIGNTTDAAGYDPLETVLLNGNGTATSPQLLEAMSADIGKSASAYNTSNFDYGNLVIGNNNYVQLVDQSSNSGGKSEAVYAVSVTVPQGSVLNLNGLDLYAGSTNVQGSVTGGIIELSPLPPAVAAVTGNGQPVVFNSSSTSTTNATSFGNVLQNTGTYDQTFTIFNNGIATLDIGSVSLPTGFTLVSAPPTTIPAKSNATFVVGLTTGTPGTFGGDVSFTTNDSSHDPFNFEINGSVQMAQATALVTDTANGTQVPNGYAVPLTTLGTDLGSTTQGGPTLASTFTITNTGNANLSIGSIVLPYGFSLLGTPTSTIGAGQSSGFTLGLGTSVPGTYSGYVTFSTNDPYHNPYTFAVTGTVIAVPAPIAQVSYNGTIITDHSTGTDAGHGTNFGFVLQGASPVVHTFTLSNIGNATLNISSISLPSGFSLVGTPATTIAANSSATFTFGLSTTSVGIFGGTVSFSTNDANNNPFTFAVTGTVGLTNSPFISLTPPNQQTTVAGQTSSFNLGSFSQTNSTGPYQVTINWGDNSAATVLTLPAAGSIPSQVHTYNVSGSLTVTESVVDSAGDHSNTATFTVVSVPAPATIALVAASNQSASPGQATSILLGNFTETGAVGPYNVSVNWGDGSGLSQFSVGNSGPLPATSHVYASVGTDAVTVTISDSLGHTSNSAQFNVTVGNAVITVTPPANQSANVAQSQGFVLGSFTETNATGPYIVTVNWGDGSALSLFSEASPGTIPQTTHTYNFAGSDTVTLTVTDSDNHTSNSATYQVVVTSPNNNPTFLAPSSQDTYNAANSTLTVTGTATIIADPAKSGVNLVVIADGAAAKLVIDTQIADGGDGDSVVHLTSLSLTNGASGSVMPLGTPANQGALVIGALTIGGTSGNWQGQLDIGSNGLDITGGSLATITSQIAGGYDNGKWVGLGITSSAAAGDTSHLTGLGVVQNNAGGTPLFGAGTGGGSFDGYSPAATDILIRYTYYGDANLSGKVDGSDYSLIDNGVAKKLTGWFNGDFNYDGVVDGSDYSLIDNAFNLQGSVAAAVASAMVAVPDAVSTEAPSTKPQKPAAAPAAAAVFSTKILNAATPDWMNPTAAQRRKRVELDLPTDTTGPLAM